MQRIFTHIERLLMTNDCVIIPEFGGFVLHPCPADYQPEVHKFCPPEKGIVFNPTLKHYDRLIPESYIQMYDMTFEEAHISMRNDVEELLQILEKERFVYFEKTGFLRKDDDGKLFFETERYSSSVVLKPYGLIPFHLPPVPHGTQKIHTETAQIIKLEKKSKRMVYMPVSRALLRVAGVSAAAFALFLLVSTPVNNEGGSSYSAYLIPSEMLIKGEKGETKETAEIENAEKYRGRNLFSEGKEEVKAIGNTERNLSVLNSDKTVEVEEIGKIGVVAEKGEIGEAGEGKEIVIESGKKQEAEAGIGIVIESGKKQEAEEGIEKVIETEKMQKSGEVIESERMQEEGKFIDSGNTQEREKVIESERMSNISTEVAAKNIVNPILPIEERQVSDIDTNKTSQKIYYAIIGSFTSEKQANQYIQQINMPDLANTGIVINDGRVRVYADRFDKRTDAQGYILRLRENIKFKDTWLFVEK